MGLIDVANSSIKVTIESLCDDVPVIKYDGGHCPLCDEMTVTAHGSLWCPNIGCDWGEEYKFPALITKWCTK